MFKKQRTYYKRILLLLAIFSLLITLPYTFSLFYSAKKQMTDSIYQSNIQYLDHLAQTFTYDRKTVSTLCVSSYFENNFQELMYSKNVQPLEALSLLRNKLTSAKFFNSSIYSIGVYNSSTQTLYSTLSDYFTTLQSNDDSLEFFQSLESPRELTPYFRTLTNPSTGETIEVFTYFVFDYPANTNPSFLVVNQRANWLLSSAEDSAQSHPVESNFFIYGDGVGLCCSDPKISPAFKEALLQEIELVHANPSEVSGTFNVTIDETRYSAAYWNLGSPSDCIVMLQEYDALYTDIVQLRNIFLIILAICCVFMVFAIVFLTRQLYNPIASLAEYINKSSANSYVSPKLNEFEQFREIYQQSAAALEKRDRYQKMHLQHIQLERVLMDRTNASCKLFQDLFPKHWLNNTQNIPLYCICISLDKSNHFDNEEDIRLHTFAVENIVNELLSKTCYVESFQTQSNDVLCIIGCKDPSYNIRSTLETLSGYIEKYFSVALFCCYSQKVSTIDYLNSAFVDIQLLKQYYPLFGSNSIITLDDIDRNTSCTETAFPAQSIQQLLSAIRDKNTPQIQRALQTLCSFCKTMNMEHIPGCIFSMLSEINYVLRENHVISQMITSGKVSELWMQLSDYDTVDALFTDTCDQIVQILSLFTVSPTEKDQRFVELVRECVYQNYGDCNFSSQMIAEHLGYSAKHTMKKFKELTGTSLVDYILQVRMEQAAQLLIHTNDPISGIGKQVGIESNSYFYKLFKGTYGCTPKEYVTATKTSPSPQGESLHNG